MEEYEYEEVMEDEEDGEYDEEEIVYVTGDSESMFDEDSNVYYEEVPAEEVNYDIEVDTEITQEARLEAFPQKMIKTKRKTINKTKLSQREREDLERGTEAAKYPVDEERMESMPPCSFDTSLTLRIREELDRHKATREVIAEETVQKPPPASTAEIPQEAEHEDNSFDLTPLPDKFFVRRSTGDANSVGFHAVAAICDKCMFCFRTKTAHSKHMTLHKTATPDQALLPRTQIMCPCIPCEVKSDCLATLVEHVRTHHEHPEMVFESIDFADLEQFRNWKAEMERLTMSRYTRSSGKHNVFSKSTYYHCHHSGNAPSQKEGSAMRNRASKKIGRSCTAFFHIKEKEDGKVSLRGCVKHFGHDLNVRSMPLSDEIKKEIAAYVLEGMNEHDIVDRLRDTSTALDRRHFVQAYEVRNVQSKVLKHHYDMAREEEAGQQTTSSETQQNYMDMEDDDVEYEEGDEIDVVSEQHIRKQQKPDIPQVPDYIEAPPYAAIEEVATSENVEALNTDPVNQASETAKTPTTEVKARKRKIIKKVFKLPRPEEDKSKKTASPTKLENTVAATTSVENEKKIAEEAARPEVDLSKVTVAVTSRHVIPPTAFSKRKYDLFTGLPAKRGPKTKDYKDKMKEIMKKQSSQE